MKQLTQIILLLRTLLQVGLLLSVFLIYAYASRYNPYYSLSFSTWICIILIVIGFVTENVFSKKAKTLNLLFIVVLTTIVMAYLSYVLSIEFSSLDVSFYRNRTIILLSAEVISIASAIPFFIENKSYFNNLSSNGSVSKEAPISSVKSLTMLNEINEAQLLTEQEYNSIKSELLKDETDMKTQNLIKKLYELKEAKKSNVLSEGDIISLKAKIFNYVITNKVDTGNSKLEKTELIVAIGFISLLLAIAFIKEEASIVSGIIGVFLLFIERENIPTILKRWKDKLTN